MSESRDYLEMTFQSINCFADDGTLCINDLEKIVGIATRDGVVDENERRVLAQIVGRLNNNELQGELLAKINLLREELKF